MNNRDDFLKDHISDFGKLLDYIAKKKAKLNHPINEKTGKSLSSKTIKNYERQVKGMEKISIDLAESINYKLENSKTVSFNALVEMAKFVLVRGDEVGKTFSKFVLTAFGASLEQNKLL